MDVTLILVTIAVFLALGAEGADDQPKILPNKPADLILPHPNDCRRTCISVVPTSEIKAAINRAMAANHVPSEYVEIQRRNLGRNDQKQEKVRYTAYMKDRKDYWCVVSFDSVLNTDIAKNFNIDCNYEVTWSTDQN